MADSKISETLYKVLSDVNEKDLEGFENALKDAPTILRAYTNSIHECAPYSEDVQALQSSVEKVIVNIYNIELHDEAFMSNVIRHQKVLRDDFNKAKVAFNINDTVTLGKMVGEIFRLTLLKFQEDPELRFNTFAQSSVQSIISGLAEGLEQKDLSNVISKCNPSEARIEDEVKKVVTELLKGTEEGVEEAVQEGRFLMQALSDATSKCDGKSVDMVQLRTDLETVSRKLENLPKNYENFIANILINETKLKDDAAALRTA
jgi:hypothetical protein